MGPSQKLSLKLILLNRISQVLIHLLSILLPTMELPIRKCMEHRILRQAMEPLIQVLLQTLMVLQIHIITLELQLQRIMVT